MYRGTAPGPSWIASRPPCSTSCAHALRAWRCSISLPGAAASESRRSSQGAAHCTFIDRGHKAIATIKKNLELTGLADRALVLNTDAFGYLKEMTQPFDLIYVAPPQYKGLWLEALRLIADRWAVLGSGPPPSEAEHEPGLVIVQLDPREYEVVELGAIREIRQKRYGNTLLVFYENSDGATSG